jgi:RNA polymerase sigma factor (sigma-70 family)
MTRSEFEHIAAQLRQRVLKVGLDFFSSKDDAEDAAQETMIQLWRYCEHIDAERNIEALAVRVAKNCCVSIYRKQHHVVDKSEGQVSVGIIDRNQTTSPHDPQVQLEAKETQRMLSETIDLLKPRERQLFEMRAVEGLSTEEVSKQTGIPKASVAVMVSTARKKVLTELMRRMKQ